jgi:hypothetical protein
MSRESGLIAVEIVAYFKVIPSIQLQRPKKIRIIWIISIPVEVRTGHILNTTQKSYCLSQLTRTDSAQILEETK